MRNVLKRVVSLMCCIVFFLSGTTVSAEDSPQSVEEIDTNILCTNWGTRGNLDDSTIPYDTREECEYLIETVCGVYRCDFTGLDMRSITDITQALIRFNEIYPNVLKSMGYIGSEYHWSDKEWVRSYVIDYCDWYADKMGYERNQVNADLKSYYHWYNMYRYEGYTKENNRIMAYTGCYYTGFEAAMNMMVFVNKYFEDYSEIQNAREWSCDIGHFPQKCRDVESTVWHELGHLLMHKAVGNDDKTLQMLYTKYKTDISSTVSIYAESNPQEFVVECFSAYHRGESNYLIDAVIAYLTSEYEKQYTSF